MSPYNQYGNILSVFHVYNRAETVAIFSANEVLGILLRILKGSNTAHSPRAGIPESDERAVACDEAHAVPAVQGNGEGRLQHPRVYDVVDSHVTSGRDDRHAKWTPPFRSKMSTRSHARMVAL